MLARIVSHALLLVGGSGRVGFQPGHQIAAQRRQQPRVHLFVDKHEGLPVHGIDPIIRGGAQTQPLARYVVTRQRRQVSVVDAHVAVDIENHFALALSGDPLLGQFRIPAHGPPGFLAQDLQLLP